MPAEENGSKDKISNQIEDDCTTRERSFDTLARGLARGSMSRSRALRLLAGALLGGMLTSTPRVAVAEKCKPHAHKCATNAQCCSRYCDKLGQVCACPPRTQLACKGPTGQTKCINFCDDPTNPCEISACNPATGGCVVNKLTGTPCNDSNSCTLGDTCQNGTCQPGPVRTCGQCLKCNRANGTCEPDANQVGNPCDDDNACTTNDRCTAAGTCVGDTPVDCDDDNPCTIDTCNPATGCVHTSVTNGTPCETDNLCTADTCQNGTCTQGSVNVTCGQCLKCDPDTGGCVPDPDQVDKPCNDGNACTEKEMCTATGTCVGTLVDCDDDNPCTVDTCNPATGCVHTSVTNGTPCDDGDPCTIDDTCQNGTCQPGQPLECGQCLTCEGGICVPDTTQNGTSCDDDNPCTTNDTCQSGVCMGTPIPGCVVCATPADCPVPANLCLQATCVGRVCGVTPKSNGTQCDDENACTKNETCQSGVCIGEPVDCNDNNPCTIDTCNPATGCVHTSVTNGTPCETDNLCTADTCQNGTCTQGSVNVTCGQCLKCNPDTGTCVADPDQVDKPCNDGNACTKNETCTAAGVCAGGTLVDCDDDNPCTVDTCNPATGCVHTSVTNGTPCETDNLCTADTCQNGTCTQGSVNVTCGQCLRCDPATGTCVADTTKNGTSCNDNNACTTGETCQNGVCRGGTLKSCSSCEQCNSLTGNCEKVTGPPCGATGSGRTCCAGTCCSSNDICCATGTFVGQCKRRSGQGCNNNNNCCSNSCVNSVCA